MNEKILVVDDNMDDYLIIKRLLKDIYEVEYDNGQKDIIPLLCELEPKCILLDYNLGPRLGTDILDTLQQDDELSNISVIMLTNEQDPEIVVKCIKYNATNYMIKDRLTQQDLILSIKNAINETNLKIYSKEQELEILKLLYIDELTGINNRRFFTEKINEEIDRCKRGKEIFSLNIIDVDNFKAINDQYGHSVGDEVLKLIAEVIKNNIRSTDYVCRFGGDEFVLMLVEMSEHLPENVLMHHFDKCAKLVSEINQEINSLLKSRSKIEFLQTETNRNYSVSIGMCVYEENYADYGEMFRIADKSMYSIKEGGGNGVGYQMDNQYITHIL